MKFLVSLALTFGFVSVNAQNNNSVCRSRLLSATGGNPVTAATILLLKSGAQTISQNDGSFIIACNKADSMVIMHTGFTTFRMAVLPGLPLPAVIRLQTAAKQLEEVQVNSVNTGYQLLPKERATGSFEVISNKLFNQQTGTTVIERLETIANGLYVDKKTNTTTPRIAIRGLSSIQGPVAPLIILDNFPYEGDLANINPNDVESITLLKDAAAASIWGARAGNGVIVITSKKPKAGQPLRVELHSNVTIAQKPNLFYYNNMQPADYIDVETFLFGKGFYTSQLNSTAKPALAPVVEILAKKASGAIPAAQADAMINDLRNQDVRNDYEKYMYQKVVNTQQAISLSTGGNSSSHFFSAGYDNNNSNLNDKLSRLTLRNSNNFRLGKHLQLAAGITYTRSNTTAGRKGYNSISSSPGNLPLYTRLADGAGNPLPVTMQLRMPYVDTVGAGKLLDWHYYALDDQNHISNKTILQSFIANAGINLKIVNGLAADIKYQYESQYVDNNTVYGLGSYFTRNLINMYSQLNYATAVVTYKVPKAGILSSSNTKLAAHNFRAQLNYTKQWKHHEVNAIAGGEFRQIESNGSSARTYGYNADILSQAPLDYINLYPTIVTGATALIPNEYNFSGTLNRYVSWYGNAAYTFRSKYSLSLSGRRDASNLFGVRTNDKWTPLWSAGLAWDLSKESFYNIKKLSVLRLRATYGFSGNADPSRSGYSVMTYGNTSSYTLLPTASVTQFNNPDLRWERTGMLNIGIDFKAFNNRFFGSVEHYRKKGKDLLGFTPVDYTTVPAFRLAKNVASMKGSGWDFDLNSINVRIPFTWETNLNLNLNTDKVTDYLITNRSAINNLTGGLSISALVGKPVYGVYVYLWAGLDPQTGDPMGWLAGKPSKDYNTLAGSAWPIDSLKYIGPSMPRLFGSMGNTFNYKGLSVSVRIAWKAGYYFLRNSINYNNLFGSRQGHGDYALRWQKPGDEQFTDVPSMVYPAVSRRDLFYNNAEILVEKGDHIRLQYITAAYDFKTLFKKLPVSNLNLYVNINNLGILWRANKHGIDPDYKDNSILPTKNYAIGIRTSF